MSLRARTVVAWWQFLQEQGHRVSDAAHYFMSCRVREDAAELIARGCE